MCLNPDIERLGKNKTHQNQITFLNQNYPNPFNPTTNITFAIPDRQSVVIKIFDALGCEVATLLDDLKEAGEHSVTFNASDLNSGIYFYVMRANGFVEIKKLVVLK